VKMWEQLDQRPDFSLEFLIAMFCTALGKFENVRRVSWHSGMRISEVTSRTIGVAPFEWPPKKSWQRRRVHVDAVRDRGPEPSAIVQPSPERYADKADADEGLRRMAVGGPADSQRPRQLTIYHGEL